MNGTEGGSARTHEDGSASVPAGASRSTTLEGGLVVEHAPEHGTFRLVDSGREVAVLDYRDTHGTWNIVHTFTDPDERSQGHAGTLVQHVLDEARAESVQVIPTCSYVRRWLIRHPDYNDLVGASQ